MLYISTRSNLVLQVAATSLFTNVYSQHLKGIYVCLRLQSSSFLVSRSCGLVRSSESLAGGYFSVPPLPPFPAATQPLLSFLQYGVYLPPFPRMDRRRPLIHYCPFPEFSSSTQFLLFSDFLSLLAALQSVWMAEIVYTPAPTSSILTLVFSRCSHWELVQWLIPYSSNQRFPIVHLAYVL